MAGEHEVVEHQVAGPDELRGLEQLRVPDVARRARHLVGGVEAGAEGGGLTQAEASAEKVKNLYARKQSPQRVQKKKTKSRRPTNVGKAQTEMS